MDDTIERLRRIIQGPWQTNEYTDEYTCGYSHPKASLFYEVYRRGDYWRSHVEVWTYRTDTEVYGRFGCESDPESALREAIDECGGEVAERLGTIDPAGLRRICEEEGSHLTVTRRT